MACNAHGGESCIAAAGCEACAVHVSQGLGHAPDAGHTHTVFDAEHGHRVFDPGCTHAIVDPHSVHGRFVAPNDLHRSTFGLGTNIRPRLSATWEHLPDVATPPASKPFPARALRSWESAGACWR